MEEKIISFIQYSPVITLSIITRYCQQHSNEKLGHKSYFEVKKTPNTLPYTWEKNIIMVL